LKAITLTRLDLNESLLFDAAKCGDIKAVIRILNADPRPDVNSTHYYGSDGYTAIEVASYKKNNVEIIRCLAEKGSAKLTPKALEIAMERNNLDAAVFLIESSNDPLSYVNSVHLTAGSAHYSGDTLLHYVCSWGRGLSAVLQLLIKIGCKIDKQDLDGNTCLHIASRNNKGDYVECPLGNGAGPSMTNLRNETAWALAVKHSSFEVITVFASKELQEGRNLWDHYSLDLSERPKEWHLNAIGSCSVSKNLWGFMQV
jgi:ankyrin repeat protein